MAFPSATALTDACFGLALVLVWALTHSYTGIEGDARIYMGRALADLDPDGVGRDMMFAMDGQSSFSLFRVMARTLVEQVGFGTTVAIISITNMLVWFAAMIVFVRSIVPGRASALVLAAVCVLPRLYTPWNLLSAGEAIAVPRPLAEAGVLLALAALCHRRYEMCIVSLILAAAFHPIMAAPGFGVLLIVLALRDRRWLFGIALLAVAIVGAAALGVPLVSRLMVTVDPVWRELLVGRTPYLFVHLWPRDSLGLAAVQSVTVLIGASWLPVRARTIVYASLAVAVLGCGASYLLGDILSDLLVLQAQLWRSLWLPAALAPVAAGLCVWRLPACGARGQIALALLCLAWIDADMFPLSVFAAVAAAAAYFGVPRRDSTVGRPVVVAVWCACILLSGMSNWASMLALRHIWPPLALGFAAAWPLVCALKLPTVPLVLAAVAAWRWPRAVATRLSVALFLAGGLSLLATTWDARTPAHADADAATIKRDLVVLLASRPGDVLWIDSDDVWYWARRPNWGGATQGGGIVFSRDLAVQWHQRAQAILDAGLATRNILVPQHDPIALTAMRLDPEKIARFCRRPDSPAWIVASLDPGAPPPAALEAKIWAPPFAQTKLYVAGSDARWRRLDRYAIIPCALSDDRHPEDRRGN